MKTENTEQFTGKYESEGSIGNMLVKNFFKHIYGLIPIKAHTALEVGCGAGYSTEKLQEKFPHIQWTGSDISETLTAMAKQRVPHAKFLSESIYHLTHADNSYDLVFALEVFEHLENPEEALNEIHRVSNQYAILSVPREPIWRLLNMCRLKYLSDFGNTAGHLNHWSKRSFKKFVSKKFRVIETHSPLPWTILLLKKK